MTQTQTNKDVGATVVGPRPSSVKGPQGTTSRRDRIVSGLRQAGVPLAAVFACGMVASLVCCLGIRELGRAILDVPHGFKPLAVPDIFPYTFAPIVGCSAAFVVAFIVKKPGPRSIHLFVTVGLKFAVLDGAIALLSLPGSTSAGSVITMVAIILFPLLIMPVQLRLIPRPGSTPLQMAAAV